MAIYLPSSAEDTVRSAEEMTPREIVAELDKHVVGQAKAKRAVAVALRNRIRRQKLSPEMAEEILPRNILMIGQTGVGKTEIARRLARLTKAPFLKVEASKFTEVGYVGRDVESMVRDLVESAIDMVREEKLEETEDRAEFAAEERLIELLLQQETIPTVPAHSGEAVMNGTPAAEPQETREQRQQRLLRMFREGKLDDRMVDVETRERPQGPQIEVFSNVPPEEMDPNDANLPMDERGRGTNGGSERNGISGLKDMLVQMFAQRGRKRTMKVPEAFDVLTQEEETRLIDMDLVVRQAIERVEDSGIIFLDEIDKIAGREGGRGPDISREGVQRDILPIVEGTTVNTKYGMVATDHILFIAAGAFHVSKPSDLIPELQGRFPIRVELESLRVEDFLRILTEPRASLVKQAIALLETEGLRLEFAQDALEEMARFAFEVNASTENIGARRLHTILEKVLEEISFRAPEIVAGIQGDAGVPALVTRETKDGPQQVLMVDRVYVERQVAEIVKSQDLSRYIL